MGLELKNVTKKFKTIEGERVMLLQEKVDVENQHFYN